MVFSTSRLVPRWRRDKRVVAGSNRFLFVVDTNPVILLFAADRRVRTITFLNIHNPNTVSEVITLRWVVPVAQLDSGLTRKHANEYTIRFKKPDIPASGDFTFGTMGGRIPLYPPGQRFELVAASSLILPLEVYLAFEDAPHAVRDTIDPVTGEYGRVQFEEEILDKSKQPTPRGFGFLEGNGGPGPGPPGPGPGPPSTGGEGTGSIGGGGTGPI